MAEIATDATQAESEVIEERILSDGGNEDGRARRAADRRKCGI